MGQQPFLTLNPAPSWALSAGELGRILILIGAFSFLAAVIASVLSKTRPNLQKLSIAAFIVGAIGLFGAFACLAALFKYDQFEFQYVFSHGDALTDTKYKIAGIWSGQQGSFLLWACTSALFGLLALKATGIYRRWFIAAYATFLGSLCGILAYETPFNILEGVTQGGQILMPSSGNGLTPSLQNYWVVIHPPTIFTGFGSLTVLGCWAVSAMLTRNFKDWARMVRPWALVSVAILGLGISMGGLWAYETLGWGGFWAWDPVENVSFVPWLFTVAFVHGLIVQTAKGRWITSNLLLGGLPFIAFVYGTFLTRSGFLADASVHSFAEMNRSALWILLGFLVVCALGFLVLWLVRGVPAGKDAPENRDKGVTRESLYKLGVTLLALFGLAVSIGMSVPFFMAVAGKPSKVVQEGLYHMVVVWFFIPIMLLMAIGPFVSWRTLGGKDFRIRMVNVVSLAVGLTGLAVFAFKWPRIGVSPDPTATINLPLGHAMPLMPWMAVLTFVCMFSVVANLWRVAEIAKHSRFSSFGGFIAHVGVAVLMAGLLLSRGFEQKQQVVTQENVPAEALGYQLVPEGYNGKEAMDRNNKLLVDVKNSDGVHFTATPGLYYLPGQDGEMQTMRWPYIFHSISHDVYLALGDPILTVWQQPVQLKPGEANTNEMFSLKYDGLTMQGKPGQMGTKFIAKLHLSMMDGRTYDMSPGVTITDQGLSQELKDAGPSFFVSLLGMNAADRSATVQVYYKRPFYPMELFYKPFTSLVWIGTGILTLGGLMAAFYRRSRPSAPDSNLDLEEAVEKAESKADAPVPAS